jgi:hypothetical protein
MEDVKEKKGEMGGTDIGKMEDIKEEGKMEDSQSVAVKKKFKRGGIKKEGEEEIDSE